MMQFFSSNIYDRALVVLGAVVVVARLTPMLRRNPPIMSVVIKLSMPDSLVLPQTMLVEYAVAATEVTECYRNYEVYFLI